MEMKEETQYETLVSRFVGYLCQYFVKLRSDYRKYEVAILQSISVLVDRYDGKKNKIILSEEKLNEIYKAKTKNSWPAFESNEITRVLLGLFFDRMYENRKKGFFSFFSQFVSAYEKFCDKDYGAIGENVTKLIKYNYDYKSVMNGYRERLLRFIELPVKRKEEKENEMKNN